MNDPPKPPDWAESTLDDDSPLSNLAMAGLYLTLIQGSELGRRFRLFDQLTLGRSSKADIILNDDRVSGLHCHVIRVNDTVMVEDNHSRNGTFIDEVRVEGRTQLRLGANLRLGHSVFRLELKSEAEITREEDLFKAATTDPLTRVPNRRWFRERAREELESARRHNRPVCLVMLDVDHFKSINDTHGHSMGDYVLATLAGLLCDQKRIEDLLCRYGGEEFLLLLRETSIDNAMIFCERLRSSVQKHPFSCGEVTVQVTVSVGVAGLRSGETLEQLIERGDNALYSAKEAGRNRVVKES
jgi:diguanylate cyclase (GGDEF)-like protein